MANNAQQAAFGFAAEYAAGPGVHPFEAAGLGKAPFELAYSFGQRPATNCDYCGTSIVNVFMIRGACGALYAT